MLKYSSHTATFGWGYMSATTEGRTSTSGRKKSDQVAKFVPDDEEVTAVSAGKTRTFAVTDRRVLDITEAQTSDGRSIETIASTLFTNVAKVDVSIQGSTTNTDTAKAIAGVVLGVGGLFVAIGGLAGDGQATTIGGLLIGVVAIGLAAWLLMNATERQSGGILIKK